MPGALLAIDRAHHIPMLPIFTEIPEQIPVLTPTSTNNAAVPRRSHHLNNPTLPRFNNVRFISQEAINSLIINNLSNSSLAFSLLKLHPKYTTTPNLEHYALAMILPHVGLILHMKILLK
jgi:hypothetical protein